MNRDRIKKPGVILALALTAMSCAANKNAGAFVAIAVSPEKPFIVTGKGASCVSASTAKSEGTDLPEKDVSANRISYKSFSLQWRSVDALTITGIRATITGIGIEGEKVIDLDDTEIAALIGKADLTIPAAPPEQTDDTAWVVNIISNDVATTKLATSPFAACGLELGGIEIKEGVTSFSAQVKIELFGYATSRKDGTQSPVRKTLNAKAEAF